MNFYTQAFPLLRLFKNDKYQAPDYRNDRTLDALVDFSKQKVAADLQIENMEPKDQGKKTKKITRLTRNLLDKNRYHQNILKHYFFGLPK